MKLIAIDGVDGAGKTFIADKLAEKLRSYHLNVVQQHFPDANLDSGKSIYKLLGDKSVDMSTLNPFAIWMMYAVNRYSWFVKNSESLKDAIVIADRYTSCSLVFQGTSLIDGIMRTKFSGYTIENFSFSAYDTALDYESFLKAYDMFGKSDPANYIFDKMFENQFSEAIKFMMYFERGILRIPTPDFTFIINAPSETIEENLRAKNKDAFEADEIFRERARIYNYLAEQYNWVKIDNTFSPNAAIELDYIFNHLIKDQKFEFLQYLIQ